MKSVVFVPGIMGSELRTPDDNEKVWPPTVIEASIGGYGRIQKLLRPDLVATKPIERVAFIGVYRCLLNDIEECGYTSNGANDRKFISFPYDWRLSNLNTADKLADRLDQEDNLGEITLIGHSMGGLVLRLLLESGKYDTRPWFSSISRLITYGTPQKGAASALNQISGGEKTLGVSAADIKLLASDSRYPSAYQLVPRSGTAITTLLAGNDELPKSIDSFDPQIVAALGLNQSNINEAAAQWNSISLSKKPKHVDYFSFVGSALKTKYQNVWDGSTLQSLVRDDSGDGTVPISSAININVPHEFSKKKHATIFEDRKTRIALYRMLDAPADASPASAQSTMRVGEPDALGISVDKESYATQDTIQVAVSYVDAQTDPEVKFQIFKINETSANGDRLNSVSEVISAYFKGANIETFTFTIEINLAPGVYELVSSMDVDDPERTLFYVS